jgi:hypothetical protein
MKRDMELVRQLMLFLEVQVNPSRCRIEIDEVPEHKVNYHLALLIEADLIDGEIGSAMGENPALPNYVRVHRITWLGHEFIDNFRSEQVWNTIKSEFKELSFSSLTEIGKQLIEGYAKNKIKSLVAQSNPEP